MVLEGLDIATYFGISVWLVIVISIWSIVWKGFALWISARKTKKVWFIVLLLVNTIGILEILYIFIFSKMDSKPTGKVAGKPIVKPAVKPAKPEKKK